jgi:hypothetical protein
MNTADKFRSDLSRALSSIHALPENRRALALQEAIARNFGFLPPSMKDHLALRAGESLGSGGSDEELAQWLCVIGSIFLRNYEGEALSPEQWSEVRDLASAGAGELDMETLTYALDLVLEHKAL